MTSTQLRTLLKPPVHSDSQRKAIETINLRFPSFEDLMALDASVVESEKQQNILRSKLCDSHSHVDDMVKETRLSVAGHLKTAQNLSLLRHSLADKFSDLSQEFLSLEYYSEDRELILLEDLETFHRNLRELQSVKEYVQAIQHALKLSEVATEQVRQASWTSSDSISGYQALQGYVSNIVQSLSAVEEDSSDQCLNLANFLEQVRDKTWVDIKLVLSTTLVTAAEKLGWPKPINYLSCTTQDRSAFEFAFLDLLKLQSIGKKVHAEQPLNEKEGLYPLQALMQPISIRFKYHFEGSRLTNKLDKPEWFLTHVQNVSQQHKAFLEDIVQGLLVQTEYQQIIAWREFTFLLLPLLSRKLKKSIPLLLEHPSLLAHTIYQTLSFDSTLNNNGFLLQGTLSSDSGAEWAGISDVILGNSDWFETWLTGEKNFVEDQYNEIISSGDAWLVAEGANRDDTLHFLKPTNSSRRVKSLVEQVTDRYSHLPRATQRALFLTKIQLPLLDSYRSRISASLDAFETLSSVFVRPVPGALAVHLTTREASGIQDPRDLTVGVAGVHRLCKALLSAGYIEALLKEWGEDIFFLQLWAEFGTDPALRRWIETNPLLPKATNHEARSPPGTVFEEMISRYHQDSVRAENMAVQLICGEIENALREHQSAAMTTSGSATELDTLGVAVSQTLLFPIGLLSSHLSFLRATLPGKMFTIIYRRIAKRLAEHIYHHQILYRGQFSLQEGKMIRSECELWVETCYEAVDRAMGSGRQRVQAPWNTLLQAGRLMALEGQPWERVVEKTLSDGDSNSDWESMIIDAVGITELGRDEVGTLLRRREDFDS